MSTGDKLGVNKMLSAVEVNIRGLRDDDQIGDLKAIKNKKGILFILFRREKWERRSAKSGVEKREKRKEKREKEGLDKVTGYRLQGDTQWRLLGRRAPGIVVGLGELELGDDLFELLVGFC